MGMTFFNWIFKSFHMQDMPKLSLVFVVSLACSPCLYPNSEESNDSGHENLTVGVGNLAQWQSAFKALGSGLSLGRGGEKKTSWSSCFFQGCFLDSGHYHLPTELMAETPHGPFLSHIYLFHTLSMGARMAA